MNYFNKNTAGGIIIAIILTSAAWLVFLSATAQTEQNQAIIGSREKIRLLLPSGADFEMVAKIDTGADSTSIDSELVKSLGLKINKDKKKTIITPEGREERDTIDLDFILADKNIHSLATVEGRTGLSTRMIIGINDLKGFSVDPSKEFIAEPVGAGAPKDNPLPIISLFSDKPILEKETKEILIIPILAFLIVIFRLLGGIETYGIFAPFVIALSLFSFNLIQGILIYTFLVLFGVTVKLFILNSLKLPHIAEVAILMFVLAATVIGVIPAANGINIDISQIFFPLIITSHLIEQFSKGVEQEEEARESFILLVFTLIVAFALSLAGMFILNQSIQTVWIIFIVALAGTFAAGKYTGLRLMELFRFSFLRKK